MDKEKAKKRARAYYEKNRAYAREYKKAYYKEHKNEIKAHMKIYSKMWRERNKEAPTGYYNRNKKRLVEYGKAYYEKNSEQMKMQSAKRRIEHKKRAVALLGGRCEICGYNRCIKALDFHHKDPNEKHAEVSHTCQVASWEKVEAEVRKCTLLCANCHRELHAGLFTLPTF